MRASRRCAPDTARRRRSPTASRRRSATRAIPWSCARAATRRRDCGGCWNGWLACCPSADGGPLATRAAGHLRGMASSLQIPTVTLSDGVEIPQLGLGVFQVPPEDTAENVTTALE